ncbi:hypothetical protein IFM89_024952 [Coptis chinensis]|uniref:Methyltransferase domain-containing protein n=1 Tax=Coptis chinensis TaxID=261450 RepID=A0A835IU36_9MAGN|nr:hypothetical protein IFM89_024952 [Coptis chinensis]
MYFSEETKPNCTASETLEWMNAIIHFLKPYKPLMDSHVVNIFKVEILAAVVNSIAKTVRAQTVLDIGAGQGYLAQVLNFQYQLSVVAIDATSHHSTVTSARAARIMKHYAAKMRKSQYVVKYSELLFVLRKSKRDEIKKDLSERLQDVRIQPPSCDIPNLKSSLVLAGLHACGDLSVTMLSDKHWLLLQLLLSDEGFENVSSQRGFPMSCADLAGFSLGKSARDLACQGLRCESVIVSQKHMRKHDTNWKSTNHKRYELGRQPANTKLSTNKTVRRIHVRGGNVKWRALRLDTGNFSWGSEAVTRKTRLLDVVYNASNKELVRTQTLVKSHHSSRRLHHLGSEYFIKTTKKQVSVVTRDSEGNIARDLACQAATRILARQLVRLRQQITNLQGSCAQIRGVATHTQAMYASTTISTGMKGTTKAMVAMNKQMAPAKQARVIKEFQMELSQMDMTIEMLSESIDETLDKDEAEEET